MNSILAYEENQSTTCKLLHSTEIRFNASQTYYSCNKNESLKHCKTLFQHYHFDIYECISKTYSQNNNITNNTKTKTHDTLQYNITTTVNNFKNVTENISKTYSQNNISNISNISNIINKTNNISNMTDNISTALILNITNNDTSKYNQELNEYHNTYGTQTNTIGMVLSLISIGVCSVIIIGLCYCYLEYKCENLRCKKRRNFRRSSRSISPESVVVDIGNDTNVKDAQKQYIVLSSKEKPPRPPRPKPVENEIKLVIQSIIKRVELNLLREKKQELRQQKQTERKNKQTKTSEAPSANLAKLALYNVMMKKKKQNMKTNNNTSADNNARQTALTMLRGNINKRLQNNNNNNKELKAHDFMTKNSRKKLRGMVMKGLQLAHEKKESLSNKRRRVTSHLDVLSEHGNSSITSKGWRRLTSIRKALDSFKPFNRTRMQKRFHNSFLQATCMHLFKEDTDVDLARVMKLNQWSHLKQQCLCMTPRRFGKTMSVGMFCASYIYSVENCEIAIFSTGRRASSKLLELIHSLICKLPGGKERILKYNQEILNIANFDGSQGAAKLCSYPSNAKTLRGVGADVVIMEEAAFMDTKVFYEVIVPLLEVEHTSLICISTPQDDQNFYSEMFSMCTPDGKPLFHTLEVSLVCEDCKKTDHPERCPHMADEIPPWKSIGKFDMVKAIYGDKTDLLQRESMGVITNDLQSVFKQKYVDQMFEKQPYELKKKPSFIFTCCDPNGGGTSQMALVSIAVELNKVVILAADSHPVKGHEQIHQLLIGHIEGLRAIPEFVDSWIIFIPEANLGHEADHMEFMIRNYRRIYTVREKDRIGIMTTNVRKELYAMETTRYISQNAIEICNKFIVTNSRGQVTMEKEKHHILEVSTQKVSS